MLAAVCLPPHSPAAIFKCVWLVRVRVRAFVGKNRSPTRDHPSKSTCLPRATVWAMLAVAGLAAGAAATCSPAWISGAVYGRPGRVPSPGNAVDVTARVQQLPGPGSVLFIPAAQYLNDVFGDPL